MFLKKPSKVVSAIPLKIDYKLSNESKGNEVKSSPFNVLHE